MTDPLLVMAGSYVAELGRAAQRARDADLLVAVDPRGAVLGTVTVDWYPVPGTRPAVTRLRPDS